MTAKIFPLAAARKRAGREALRSAGLDAPPSRAVPDSFADLPLEFLLDVDPDELQDFVDADEIEVVADPVFKETLRRRLWSMVSSRLGSQRGRTPER